MKSIRSSILLLILVMSAAFIVSGCGDSGGTGGGSGGSSGGRETCTTVLSPEASGGDVRSAGSAALDVSNTSEGYLMVKYSGSAEKIKIQITGPDGNIYTYTSKKGDYQTFPLTAGNGSYRVEILENISGTIYNMVASESVSVSISDELKPFLYPNQYVWFTADSEAVSLAQELSGKSSDDISFVEQVYKYVTKNIKYDTAKASDVPVDYIPDIDETLATGKGICFDYASLMASMLRCQNIPTKLVVGYSGSAYHAWISVYLDEVGWVDNIIEFDGKDWSLMDPTLASNNSDKTVKQYVGDGSNYTAEFQY